MQKSNKEEFVKRLNSEAKKQEQQEEERTKKLDKLFNELSQKGAGLNKLKKDFEKQSKHLDKRLAEAQNRSAEKERPDFRINSKAGQ